MFADESRHIPTTSSCPQLSGVVDLAISLGACKTADDFEWANLRDRFTEYFAGGAGRQARSSELLSETKGTRVRGVCIALNAQYFQRQPLRRMALSVS